MRTNMVGTNCACVTRSRSITSRQACASKRSISTRVPPLRCTVIDHTSGAEW